MRGFLQLLLVVTLVAGTLALMACGETQQTTPAATSQPAATQPAAPTPTPAAPAATIDVKLSATVGEMSPPTKPVKWWAQEVEKRTNGRVKFSYFWAGSLTASGEELEGVKTGLADAVIMMFLAYPDKLPLGSMGSLMPFGPTDVEMAMKVWDTVYAHPAVINDFERYNTKLLAGMCPVLDSAICSKDPIKTLADIKGKKIGISGVSMANWLSPTGAVGVNSGIGNRYMELKTGVLQGSLLSIDAHYMTKSYEVAPYVTKLGMGSNLVCTTIVNKDFWNKLPPDIQKIMEDTYRDAQAYWLEECTATAKIAEDKFREVGAVYDLPFEDIQTWTNELPNLLGEWAKANDAKGLPGTEIAQAYMDACKKAGFKFSREWSLD